jgi:Spy/CpxP family protein refolding chaperone
MLGDMKKTLTISLLAVALTSMVALTGFGGGCGHNHSPAERAEWMKKRAVSHVDDALDDLDATDDQRVKVQALTANILGDATGLLEDHQRAKLELKAQWDSKSPDSQRVHAIVDARVDALSKILHKVADAGLQLHGILTAEQRADISRWGE